VQPLGWQGGGVGKYAAILYFWSTRICGLEIGRPIVSGFVIYFLFVPFDCSSKIVMFEKWFAHLLSIESEFLNCLKG
jgi:hypothetical protein